MRFEPEILVFRPDRPGIRKVLGDLEAAVMELVWARPPRPGVTVREIFEALHRRRRIAYTTVMTTMARLARKKMLRVERRGTAFVYYPAFSPEEFVSRVVARILENLLVGFAGPRTVLKTLDPEVAMRLKRLRREIARRRRSERDR